MDFSENVSPEVLGKIEDAYQKMSLHMDNIEIVDSVSVLMELSGFGNKYFNDSEIWKMVKQDQARASEIMLNLLNIVEALRRLLQPFLPEAYERLSQMLGAETVKEEVGKDFWVFDQVSGYPDLKEVKPLFRKLEQELV